MRERPLAGAKDWNDALRATRARGGADILLTHISAIQARYTRAWRGPHADRGLRLRFRALHARVEGPGQEDDRLLGRGREHGGRDEHGH